MIDQINIVKENTCAVTGHRLLKEDFDKNLLRKVFEYLIENGKDTFLIGMAVGFDTECFKLLEELRKSNNIKIIACIPCPTQSLKFSNIQKKEYERMCLASDQKIILSKEYTPYCMQKRNMFMVDNCSVIVCYLREKRGGTANTINYAKKQGTRIIRI